MTISFSHTDADGAVHYNTTPSEAPQTGGQHLTVYRAARQDATNGGISSTHDDLTLVGWVDRTGSAPTRNRVLDLPESVRGPWASNGTAPAVVLVVTDSIFGRSLSLVPVAWSAGAWQIATGTMSGGNYATGDARFAELLLLVAGVEPHGPVKIHDRIEG